MNGVLVQAAGVVPYVEMKGRGVFFLLQEMSEGTRAGKLCDFGGRREKWDADAYATAARELCEETAGLFGDTESLARRLRDEAAVRILNHRGKYVTFFLKVSYCDASLVPEIDEGLQRNCRWWRPHELINVADEALLARLVTPAVGPLRKRGRGSSSLDTELSSFHKAVCKTLTLENAHPHAHERWHSTVLSELEAAGVRKDAIEAAASHSANSANVMVNKLPASPSPSAPNRGDSTKTSNGNLPVSPSSDGLYRGDRAKRVARRKWASSKGMSRKQKRSSPWPPASPHRRRDLRDFSP